MDSTTMFLMMVLTQGFITIEYLRGSLHSKNKITSKNVIIILISRVIGWTPSNMLVFMGAKRRQCKENENRRGDGPLCCNQRALFLAIRTPMLRCPLL